jgi:microcystin-dependent protein
MAPRNVSKQQAEQADTGEDSESEQETLDPKVISRDMEKNVGTTRIELPAHGCNLLHVTSPTTLTNPRQTHARKTQKRNQLSAKYQQEISSLEQQVASMTGSAAKQLYVPSLTAAQTTSDV